MKKEIKSIEINDEFVYIVGENNVIKIIEHLAQGEGDRWYCDIEFEDGTTERRFDVRAVIFNSDVEEIPQMKGTIEALDNLTLK